MARSDRFIGDADEADAIAVALRRSTRKDYNPDQPRDEQGRFAAGPASAAAHEASAAAERASEVAAAQGGRENHQAAANDHGVAVMTHERAEREHAGLAASAQANGDKIAAEEHRIEANQHADRAHVHRLAQQEHINAVDAIGTPVVTQQPTPAGETLEHGGGATPHLGQTELFGDRIAGSVPEQSDPERQRLASSPVVSSHKLGGGANETRIVELADGERGVFKPASGESEELFPARYEGRYYAREAAAYDAAEILGVKDLVPATVERDIDGEHGSLQKFVDDADTAERARANDYDSEWNGEGDLARAAAFDLAVGNADRHHGNWMLKDDGGLALIDHGMAFPNSNEGFTFNHEILDRAADEGMEIPKEAKAWGQKADAMAAALRTRGFTSDEIEATTERLKMFGQADDFGELKNMMRSRGMFH